MLVIRVIFSELPSQNQNIVVSWGFLSHRGTPKHPVVMDEHDIPCPYAPCMEYLATFTP